MLTNILSLTLRRFSKQGKHFVISLLSLSVGIASIILMLFYIQYEQSYDKFNPNHDRIHRVERISINGSGNTTWDSTPYRLADDLQKNFPEITKTACMAMTGNFFSLNNQLVYENDGIYADNSALDLFGFDLIQGDKNSALKEPMSIVLSKSLAEKILPSGNIVGKDLKIDKKFTFKVTGVYTDYPENSHLKANYLLSFDSYDEVAGYSRNESWTNNNASIYVLLNEGSVGDHVSHKIKDVLTDNLNMKEGEQEMLGLRPLVEIYSNSKWVRNDKMLGRRNDSTMLYLFFGVALFTMLITVVNYINSVTAQLLGREKEIAIKKVLSISKNKLRQQFVIESCFEVLIAFFLAIGLVYIAIPIFNTVVARDIVIPFFEEWKFFLGVLGGALLLATLVGLYPVVFLSSLKISSFLQGVSSLNRRKKMRKGLLILQLTFAIPLVLSALLFIDQINYLENKDLGFSKESLLVSSLTLETEADKAKFDVVKNTLLRDPEILNVSIANSGPFAGGYEKEVNWDVNEPEKSLQLRSHDVDYDFLDTYKMTLLEGRNFSKEKSTDIEKACIVNETALKLFGWTAGAGQKIKIEGKQYDVVGTVKDFHDYTLFYAIPPLVLTLYDSQTNRAYVSVKVAANASANAQRKVNAAFNEYYPNTAIDFGFFDRKFNGDQFFTILKSMSKVFIFFAFLVVFQAIIGLYNLVSFSLKIQRKTIAIHKVMGAGNSSLFAFLTKEYLILFAIAVAISLTGVTILNTLTSDMLVYKVDANPVRTVIAVVAILLFLILTISGKIFQASRQNPVVDLKADN